MDRPVDDQSSSPVLRDAQRAPSMDLQLGPGIPPPFYQLGALAFERLCRDLLAKEPGVTTCDIHGVPGQGDLGVDLVARRAGAGVLVGQCKAYQLTDPAGIHRASTDFLEHLEHWKAQGVTHFVLMVGSPLDRTQQQDAITVAAAQFKVHGITYAAWSSATIAQRLAPHPQIVEAYCHPADAWRGRICGPTRRAARAPFVSVPSPSQHFVGRVDDLDKLQRLLTQGDATLSASIGGLAGIGKTELAIHLAQHFDRNGTFPGGIYWLPAENEDLTATWGAVVADSIGVTAGPVEERAAEVCRRISRGPERSLVILDNVTTWTEAEHPRPLPEGTHVTLLVTTRTHALGGNRFREQRLGFLDNAASRKLVAEISQRDIEAESGFDDLIEYLSGHALALELAGAYLHIYPEISPANYLAKLTAGRDVEAAVTDQVRYARTVNQALMTVWDAMEVPGRRAWLIAACFENDHASPAISDPCGLDGDARRQLRRFHLIDDEPRGWWRMHRLIREFGRNAGPGADRLHALRAFVGGVINRARAIDGEIGFRVYAPERTHFDAALRLASPAGISPRQIWFLQASIGAALHSMGLLAASKRLLTLALESALKNLGEDHPSVATLRSNLAGVLYALGDLPEAKRLLTLALESALKNLGDDHPSVATSRSNLGAVLQALGDLPEAKRLHTLALDSDLKNLGEDHSSVAVRRSNLGAVLQALGDLPEAKRILTLALDSNLRNLGEDHPLVAACRSNLAAVHRALGDLPEAKRLHTLALDSDLKNLGEDHPSVATGRSNLAGVLHDLGEYPEARRLLTLALDSDLKNLGEDHPSVATSRSNLGAVLQALGDLPEAKRLHTLALDSDLKNLGEDHPSVATRRSNLGAVLRALGDLPEAKRILTLALDSNLRNLGEDHPSVAACRSNLGAVLRALGDLPEAKRLLTLALDSNLRRLGEDHPYVAIPSYNLAAVLEAQADVFGALDLIRRRLASEAKGLGAHHPSVAATRARLASLLARSGDATAAACEARRAIADVSGEPIGSRYRRAVEALTRGIAG